MRLSQMPEILLWQIIQSRSQTWREAWEVRVFLDEEDIGHGDEDDADNMADCRQGVGLDLWPRLVLLLHQLDLGSGVSSLCSITSFGVIKKMD